MRKILSICGTSSCGKSSSVTLLHKKLPSNWLIFNTDNYLKMLGYDYEKIFCNKNINEDLINDDSYFVKNDRYYLEKNGDDILIKYGKKSIALFDSIPKSVEVLIKDGFDVILEAFVETKEHIDILRKKFDGVADLYFVYMFSDEETLEKREKKRCNRVFGTSKRWLKDFNCRDFCDLAIDTSRLSPKEVSDIILTKFNDVFFNI